MTVFYVYQLRIQSSEMPFYIGKGKGGRMYRHLSADLLKNPSHKTHTILKAREAGLEVLCEKLAEDLSEDEALELEEMYIWAYGRRIDGSGILTNIKSKGDDGTGYKHSEETLAKLRGRKRSPEARAKMSAAKKGKPSPKKGIPTGKPTWNKGRSWTEEERAKISERTKAGMAQAGFGRSITTGHFHR